MKVWTVTNLKPGTGKTTTAVWLAHALHEQGHQVVLVDADPGGTRLKIGGKTVEEMGRARRWSELAEGFPFPVISLATRDLHRVLPGAASEYEYAVIDSPPLEDAQGVASAAIRAAGVVILSVAPTTAEVDGMAPVLEVVADLDALRAEPARVCVLLNRCVAGASSTSAAAEQLADAGHYVLTARIPRKELYAQSHGWPVTAKGSAYWYAAEEIRTYGGTE